VVRGGGGEVSQEGEDMTIMTPAAFKVGKMARR
jgi:hypothetical protein